MSTGKWKETIKVKDKQLGLSRVVSGYSWEWKTKNLAQTEIIAQGLYDISLQGQNYVWNATNCEWILRSDSVNEIGCVHTIQGYDLNYVGVILGREIDYDPDAQCLVVDNNLFYDKYVKAGSSDEEIKTYILNAYRVMMSRGIKGCFVYAYNKNLKEYLTRFFDCI